MVRLHTLLVAGVFSCALAISAVPREASAESFIVREGAPNAEIVVAEDAPRLTALGAEELRDYIQKISGAELPIVHEPTGDAQVAIYVGWSEHTEGLVPQPRGLKHGAFRMVSGPDWLVLLGHDADFEPTEPWARNHGDRPRAQQEWEELTGGTWGNPMNSIFRNHHRASGIWIIDEGGSLQAVYEFLRDLGVRWYMPGELGEVVPTRATIPLPRVDRTVKPDFPYRDLRLGNVPQYPWEDLIWAFRLGLNNDSLAGSHGMRSITSAQEMKDNHPEYYAMYGGRRETEFRGSGHACFSSEGLLQETIRYSRARFDHHNKKAVSVFPQDGYRHCECEVCRDKTASEVVWEFVNNVAKELYESHPDRFVLGGAYTQYREPPDTIEQFSPNVVVRISWRRPGIDEPEQWNQYWDLVEQWEAKLAPQRLMRNANVQWSASPDFPIIFPRSVAHELGAMKGLSLGEASSVPRSRDQRWERPGLSHLNMYVTARYFWDAGQDLGKLLDEYYTLFYGPAADAMREAFEFAETAFRKHHRPSADLVSIEDRIELVKRVQAAREAAGDSVYGQRIQVILDDLTPLEEHEQALREREEMGDPRKDAPVALAGDPGEDKEAPVYGMRDLRTGEDVDIETTFQVTWEGDAIVFDVRCEEPDIENMPVTLNVWGGDSVAILIETQFLAYYHLEINPDGVLFDADWSRGRAPGFDNWSSMAEVEAERGDDYWRLVVRVPVVPPEEGEDDPLHFVVGERPTPEAPWFFNVGRSRGLGDDRRTFGFSPTGGTYHVPQRFGRLYIE